MKKVFIKDTTLTIKEIDELIMLHEALSHIHAKANNLHKFLSAEVSIQSLNFCLCAMKQPECYMEAPHYLIPEPSDDVVELLRLRIQFTPHVVFATA